MKRVFKFVLMFFLTALVCFFAVGCIVFVLTPTTDFNEKKLLNSSAKVCFYDCNDKPLEGVFLLNYGGMVDLEKLPKHLKNAFVAVEDKRFFKHNGIDYIGLLRATFKNLTSLSLRQGGSTISQQLIKNTHLSSEKTFKRKIAEFKLTKQLESSYSKNEILQFYLNSIYFGEGAYGVESAARTYFNKPARDLTLSECACLAGLVKAPSKYNPRKAECKKRRDLVLDLMYEQEFISASEYDKALKEEIITTPNREKQYFKLAFEQAIERCNLSPYGFDELHIFTHFDKNAQDAIDNSLVQSDYSKKVVAMNKFAQIMAVHLPDGDYQRMPASTIKPLIAYAPAFELGIASPATKILDEKCDFGNFSPSNYGEKYYGWVSLEDALSKSLNVPAVKLLQSVGVKEAKKHLEKMNIKIDEEGLNLALGAYGGGVSLTSLCASYCTFFNGGEFLNPTFLRCVKEGNNTIYSCDFKPIKVFRSGTCDLINKCLMKTVKSGTAKSLFKNEFDLCAKTGTNGNEWGNTDAYAICYSSEHLFAIWAGNADNSLMPNSVTGGFLTGELGAIIDEFYAQKKPENFKFSDDVTRVKLCKLAYEQGKLLLADELAPERFVFYDYFLKGFEPTQKSTIFSEPQITDATITVENGKVKIEVQKPEHVYFEVVRSGQDGNQKIAEQNDNLFCDANLISGTYEYQLIPFVKGNEGQKIYGEPFTLPFIKITDFPADWPWWDSFG